MKSFTRCHIPKAHISPHASINLIYSVRQNTADRKGTSSRSCDENAPTQVEKHNVRAGAKEKSIFPTQLW